MKTCINCNKELTGKYQKKYCSNSCSASHTNSLTPRRTKTSARWHDCPMCGTLTSNPKFCSRTCQSDWPKTPQRKREVQNRKNEANARYRASKKSQTPSNANREAIKEFYNNCPPGYEVDHIIPISKGGLHELNNLQYLTIADNRRKSNKVEGRVGIKPTQ